MKFHSRIALALMILGLVVASYANGLAAKTLGPPSELKLVIQGKGFLLTWKASPDDPTTLTGYEIVRANVASGPFQAIATVGKGILKYYDGTAHPEVIYYYKVRALADKVYSGYSNTVTGERPGY